MSTQRKGLPPRVQLRERDSLTGSYPSIARISSDNRTGVYTIGFDDTNTINFNTNETLVFPVGLRSDSQYLVNTSSITATGVARKGLSDNFVSIKKVGQDLKPFIEDGLFEQNQTSNFYLTGSDPADTTIGFGSKLGSKTSFSFSLYVTESFVMSPNSASIIYYNNTYKSFDLAGGDDALENPEAQLEQNKSCLGTDGKLFDPFGIPIISGTSNTNNQAYPFIGKRSIDNANFSLIDAITTLQTGSVLLNENFAATEDQLISLSDMIDSPFLLESCVIELPISCSDGWFEDKTRVVLTGFGAASDAGGPCTTVALMRQERNNKRELILSSTFIPAGDTGSIVYETSSDPIFEGFGTFDVSNNFIVESTGISKAVLTSKAAITNGLNTVTQFYFGSSGDPLLFGEVTSITPLGRSMNARDVSGRSYFGKEFSFINLQDYKDSEPENTGQNPVGFVQNHQISPYVLFPEDKLIFSVSKHRAAGANLFTHLTTGGGGENLILSSSHELAMWTGEIKIKLYGSQIRKNEEFHDTLNQPLTSDAVHEVLHYDNPVLDQFDVESVASFSGSYSATFYTASYDPTYVNSQPDSTKDDPIIDVSSNRSKEIAIGSMTNQVKIPIYKSLEQKNIPIVSENERYYDTLLPKIDDMIRIRGGDVLYGSITAGPIAFLPLGTGTGPGAFSDLVFVEDWDRLYLFSNEFSDVPRLSSPFREITTTGQFNGISETVDPYVITVNNATTTRTSGSVNLGNNINTFNLFSLLDRYIGFPRDSLLSKGIYGFGDAKNNSPVWRFVQTTGARDEYYGVYIRGFKYGLLNTSKENKKYMFRRDRFGQFRDMIEQSRDSKIFNEKTSKTLESVVRSRFVGQDGSVADPEDTFSSNLSFESTSSLPYFDGVARNRGALPSTTVVS